MYIKFVPYFKLMLSRLRSVIQKSKPVTPYYLYYVSDERSKSRRFGNVSLEVHPGGQMNVSNPQIGQVHIHQDMRYFNISSPNIGVMTRLRHRRELRGNDDQSLQDASKREHVMEMFSI